jgi:hypothetical protein
MSWREYFDKPISRYCPTIEVDKKQLFKLYDAIDKVLCSAGLPGMLFYLDPNEKLTWYTSILEANAPLFTIRSGIGKQFGYNRNLEDENKELKYKIERRDENVKRLSDESQFLRTENHRLKNQNERLKLAIEQLESENSVLKEGKERVVIIRELPPITKIKE